MRPVPAKITGRQGRLSGQQVMRCRRMIHIRMSHRTDQRQIVRSLRQQRKVLADLNPRNIRVDRTKLTANLCRSIGLQIPCILMSRPAPHEQQDAGLRATDLGQNRRFRRSPLSLQQFGKRQSQQSHRSSAQSIAPTKRWGMVRTRTMRTHDQPQQM